MENLFFSIKSFRNNHETYSSVQIQGQQPTEFFLTEEIFRGGVFGMRIS